MNEENKRPWGEYHVIGKTKIIEVKPNQRLSLQFHNNRDEFWKIIQGNGKVTIGKKIIECKEGDTFLIPKKAKHRIESNKEGIKFIEIATGEVDEKDIVRLEDDYNRKEKIVAASGYFDPIHVGHIEYLKLAKNLGTKLIVILNNDEQAKLKKGKSFMPLEERKIILESLKFVDEVFISIDKDSTVCKSLEKIKPNIFAKGGDRFSNEIPEAKICKELNIKIIDGLGEKIQSSSNLTKIK
jgi:D-beta-D-heptose 7-phosphate kinase/D-beta-D-heptose 1-phosphate adenosyltransferase